MLILNLEIILAVNGYHSTTLFIVNEIVMFMLIGNVVLKSILHASFRPKAQSSVVNNIKTASQFVTLASYYVICINLYISVFKFCFTILLNVKV